MSLATISVLLFSADAIAPSFASSPGGEGKQDKGTGVDSAALPSQEELIELLKEKDALLEEASGLTRHLPPPRPAAASPLTAGRSSWSVQASKKAEEAKDRLLRTLADMENLRERTARQSEQTKQFAIQARTTRLLGGVLGPERGTEPPCRTARLPSTLRQQLTRPPYDTGPPCGGSRCTRAEPTSRTCDGASAARLPCWHPVRLRLERPT